MKLYRLTRPEDFRLVYQRGRVRFGRYLAVHCLPVADTQSKIGISVSKKVGKAVVRNRVKRRLRAILQEVVCSIQPGYYIVIGSKVTSRQASFWELREDLFNVMKGLGLLR